MTIKGYVMAVGKTGLYASAFFYALGLTEPTRRLRAMIFGG